MRFLCAAIPVFALFAPPALHACSCAGPSPHPSCSTAAEAAAVFTGTVLDIVLPPRPTPPAEQARQGTIGRLDGDLASLRLMERPLRVVRLQVTESLNGVEAWQKEIESFSGKPDSRIYNFTLPDRQPERIIEGSVLTYDGQPAPHARIGVYDSFDHIVADSLAGSDGRFTLRLFAYVAYRLHAVWPGNAPNTAISAVPVDIQPGGHPVNLRLVLTQSGNSLLGPGRRSPGIVEFDRNGPGRD